MKFGAKFSGGAGHRVYEDAEDDAYLLKVPRFHERLKGGHERAVANLAAAREHFGEWLPETNVLKNPQTSYVIRQEKILNAQHLTPALLRQEHIRMQFVELLSRHEETLREHGKGLDLFGFVGSVRCELSNVLSSTKPEMANVLHGTSRTHEGLFVVDMSLINTTSEGCTERMRAHVIDWWNRRTLSKYFGIHR